MGTSTKDSSESLQHSHAEMHPFTLKYRGDAERFEDEHLKQADGDSHKRIRLIAGLGALLYMVFSFYDLTYPAAFSGRMMLVRFGLTIPPLLFLFGLTYFTSSRSITWLLNFGVVMVIALSIVLMQVVLRDSDPFVFIAMLLVQMSMALLLQPSFVNALAINVSILLLFIAADLYYDIYAPMVAMRVMVYIVVGGIVSTLSCYVRERSTREQFYLGKLVDEQRERLYEAEKLEAIREVARAVAHEFNSPLGSILGAYDFAVRPRIDQHQERERDLLQQIPRSIQRMESLVSQLLEVTRFEKREYVKGLTMMDLKASSEPKSSSRSEVYPEA